MNPLHREWDADEFSRDRADLTRIILSLPKDYGTMPESQLVKQRQLIASAIDELLKKYPDHPGLLLDRAEWEADSLVAIQYVRRSISVAQRHGLPDHEARVSLAEFLVHVLRQFDNGLAELDRVREQVLQGADLDLRQRFADVDEHARRHSGDRCDCGAILRNLERPQCPQCGAWLD